MASISLDLSGGSGSVECQANFNFQVSLVYFPIHDEDLENQQPSPHPMPPIILPQAFLHAPNTFKPVSHIGAMNNTSSTVLSFKNVVYSMRSGPKPKRYLEKFFFNIIFPYIVPKPKLYLYKFLPLYFRTLSRNPSKAGRPN